MTKRRSADYLRRESGVLLHPTCLPGPHGIGDLGTDARSFVDFLEDGGQRLWQMLPLGPVGHGNSPYAAPSAMGGNPLLISLEILAKEGLLGEADLQPASPLPADHVDYGAVAAFKMPLLRQAYRRFMDIATPSQLLELDQFCRENGSWLDDYALFAALKAAHRSAPWTRWEREVAARQPKAMERCRHQLAEEIQFRKFLQLEFARQWRVLKRYANDRGVRIVGDIPIFVALDSADVWSRPEMFYLDERGNPSIVSGVPPDYFSKTGQRWGNPLYRWDVLARQGYDWWVERFRVTLAQVDLVRIDHFRGFQAYWEVPAQHRTAERGRWVQGPGEQLFHALEEALGPLPVIAEDLGIITPDVELLRDRLGYPGMKVLQFAFGDDARNPHLPHNLERRCVLYTGTHDNDTTVGWFSSRTPRERAAILRYLGTDGREIHWDMIRLALASVAEVAVVPVQDLLGLGSEARMNLPGHASGNWGWRLTSGQLRPELAARLRELAITYGRCQS
ncbi:MAG: 4-alpha-glucanotransferase [Chloroflexota bacterium]